MNDNEIVDKVIKDMNKIKIQLRAEQEKAKRLNKEAREKLEKEKQVEKEAEK